MEGKKKMVAKALFLCGFLGTVLSAGGAWAQGTGPGKGGVGFGTTWVKPSTFLVGPILTNCGTARMPVGGGTVRAGCPSAIVMVPPHYQPVPKPGWRLVGYEKRHLLVLTYECVTHWVLGIIPLPISKECVGPAGMKNLEDYVLSWWAYPLGWETPRAVKEPR